MPNINVTLSDTEYKALQFACLDVDEWVQNAATARAHAATNDIITLNTQHCNDNGIAISVGRDAQVNQAYDLKVVVTAAEREAMATM
jgi:hypothetical protein